jgi:hypothetical protein
MYKRVTFQELIDVKNPLLQNVQKVMKKQQIPYFKKFLGQRKKAGKQTIFFERSTPKIQIGYDGQLRYIRDIQNKLELSLDEETISQCHAILKQEKKIDKLHKKTKAMDQLLRDKFTEGSYRLIHDKPYIVYDIETTYGTNDLRQLQFLIGYSIESSPDKEAKFKYIDPDQCKKFFNYLLHFDGRIIWYNHTSFDNLVTGYNAQASDEDIEILQKKSLDPFLFMQQTIGKMIGLNAVSKALVNVGKTLESGKEAEKLYFDYRDNGNEKAMKELKSYCKNDVKMTLLVWLALLHQQKIRRDGEEMTFDQEELIQKYLYKKKKQTKKETKQWFFQ